MLISVIFVRNNFMDFIKLVKKRYSCRNFAPDGIPDEALNLILEAGRLAPSAANYQPWHFIVLKTPEKIASIQLAYNREWFKKAAVVIAICGDTNISWKRKDGKIFTDVDIAIAADHMTLQAAELNIGTCWVCNFDKDICSKTLDLPTHIEPIVLLPMGYPLDKAEESERHHTRKILKEIVHYGKF